MRTLVIIITVIVIIVLLLLFTQGGQKVIKKAKGEEVIPATLPVVVENFSDISSSVSTIKKPLKFSFPTITMPVIKQGKDATPQEAENMLKLYIRKAYTQLSIMKTPFNGIKDEDIKKNALTYGRTYKEELANSVIKSITKNTHPFGNINGTSISPNILNKYTTTSRNKKLCRFGVDIDKLILKGIYKDFTSKTGSCKENKYIASI